MRNRLYMVLGLVLAVPAGAFAQETDSVIRPPVPEVVAPPVVEKPKPAEKPRPVEKPRAPVENIKPAETSQPAPAVKPAEIVAPAAVTASAAPVTANPQGAGYSFACLALSFAMLIIGVAAGFVWRHLMSRRKLGGMSVRIGTWRGIP